MPGSSAPEPPRLHLVDLTPADAEAITGFLAPRLRAQMDEHRFGTPPYRTAFALDAIVHRAGHGARRHAQDLAADSFYDRHERLRCLHALQDAWNLLWQAAFPWREEDGYDRDRWVCVEYIDAEHAARGEAMKAEIDAELRAERSAAARAEGGSR
ncbi:hypothetical protein [Streptomyces rubradiris]|uniref:Uncharacterized protein n=1 Tax=Streptomyces rubradiris TaxID=285531 RepID=A0ABQ3RA99_STRRR|nr:hypothetical protein [Streptomyces rubradiris]GHH25946.1 hypothetical protein GCM10018792_65750 [Streptomyces rubradiris]GHI52780.1 hypothetical protein Srubr_26260 [Streptomyces rubradiris]